MTSQQIKDIKKEFYQTLKDDREEKNSPTKFILFCHECGQEMDEDGVWSWFEPHLQKRDEEVINKIEDSIIPIQKIKNLPEERQSYYYGCNKAFKEAAQLLKAK